MNWETDMNKISYSSLHRIWLNKIEYNWKLYLNFKSMRVNIPHKFIINSLTYMLLNKLGSMSLYKTITC